jgi:DNA-binding MarR family transcriptional regulator/N-acetylglutamate synthase-like GNAT family acetyltransferase
MEFFNQTGKMAIGSRLRMLADKVTDDASKVYQLFDVDLQPKWFPVFHVLSQGEYTITEIAQQIGHSHPSVSKIVSEMSKHGIVTENKDENDGRKNIVRLSEKGKAVGKKLEDQLVDVNSAVGEILANTRHNLWNAIEEWEFLLEQKSLLKRVVEQKKLRESKDVSIVRFEDKYAAAFKELNEEWISSYFKMETADYKSLDHPKEYILDKGGLILIALLNGDPVGTCALIKMEDPEYDYELAKMAVSPKAQGKSIGWLLGNAIVNEAKALGAGNIYLESNTLLKPAINLYHKLGFKKVFGRTTPYERCNIQMELKLNLAPSKNSL